ncbi:hypothetical protein D3C76_1838550 [compost metagenome]
MHPGLDSFAKQRLIKDCQMETLSVVNKLLKLQVGHEIACVFIRLCEEKFRNVDRAGHVTS